MKVFAFLLMSVSATVLAQLPASGGQPFGSVRGRIFCQDSGSPARFAGISLLVVAGSSGVPTDPATLGRDPDLGKVLVTAMAQIIKGSNLSTMTGIDGAFSLDKVPPGTYYILPAYPGYLSPISGYSQQALMKPDAALMTAVEKATQKIVVEANHTENVSIELVRGATLSGKVTYDDGAPAVGISPTLVKRGENGKWTDSGSPNLSPLVTDDNGRFRFYGLAPGQYAVRAALPTTQVFQGVGQGALSVQMHPADALIVYSGGAIREKEIKPIEVKSGEQYNDIEVIFPLNGLHSISGSVVAKSDNHSINSGTVQLQDPDTKTTFRSAMVTSDGTFRMNYVPEGQYLLSVTGAADTQPKNGLDGELSRMMMNSKTLKSFGQAQMSVIVKGDVDAITLVVPDAQSKAAD